VLSIDIVEEHQRVFAENQRIKREKLFIKESQYLTAIQFCIFDDEIPSSPQKKSPRKSFPTNTRSIPSLSINLTLTLTAVSTVARDLKVTAPKSIAISPKRSVIVPHTLPATTHSGRIIKRHSGGQ
jgi:hypothetical protein